MTDIFNYKLEENVYHGTSENDIDEIKSVINSFSKELVERRRDIPYEGGLQAIMIISDDKFGAKVTERDGCATHFHSFINTVKFLNGDNNFVTIEGSTRYGLIKQEMFQLSREYINVRILDGQDNIMFYVTSNCEKTSEFQGLVLSTLLDTWSEIKMSGIYKNVEVGISLPEYNMEFCTDWDNKDFNSEIFNK